MSELKIGWVGVGIMGNGMVHCLLKAGRSVTVWNRDVSKAEALKKDFPNATVAATAGDVVKSCDLIYCCLSTLDASEAVFPGMLEAVCEGKRIVDCATLTPERMIFMSQEVIAKKGTFLEAPVSGSKGPAEAGLLIFLCGGDEPLYREVKDDLAVMGKADLYFGEIGRGSKMKLVVNMMMGEMMTTLSEGLQLANACGLPADAENGLLKVLDLGVMSNPLFKMKGPKMLAHDHAPNFPLKHAQKDMRFALQLAENLKVDLPVAKASNGAFEGALKRKRADEDFSAVYEEQDLKA